MGPSSRTTRMVPRSARSCCRLSSALPPARRMAAREQLAPNGRNRRSRLAGRSPWQRHGRHFQRHRRAARTPARPPQRFGRRARPQLPQAVRSLPPPLCPAQAPPGFAAPLCSVSQRWACKAMSVLGASLVFLLSVICRIFSENEASPLHPALFFSLGTPPFFFNAL